MSQYLKSTIFISISVRSRFIYHTWLLCLISYFSAMDTVACEYSRLSFAPVTTCETRRQTSCFARSSKSECVAAAFTGYGYRQMTAPRCFLKCVHTDALTILSLAKRSFWMELALEGRCDEYRTQLTIKRDLLLTIVIP